MYDVLYYDPSHGSSVVAAGLARESAKRLACHEARRRRAGRMFAAGSPIVPAHAIVIVPAELAQDS